MLYNYANISTIYTNENMKRVYMEKTCKKCDIKKEIDLFGKWRAICNDCRNLQRRSQYYPSSCLHCKTEFRPGVRGRYKFCSETCRFVSKVYKNPETQCWEWKAGKSGDGYGDFVPLGGKSGLAHRASYKLFKGPIKEGLWVLHICNNRNCVNPDHLKLGTHKDNMKDMHRSKRNAQPRGEKAGNSKLTNESIIKIREMAQECFSYAKIARIFNMSAVQISNIVRKISWKHI